MAERPDVEGAKARAEAATPGPWEWGYYDGFRGLYDGFDSPVVTPITDDDPGGPWLDISGADATFIAAARTDVPDLVAYIEELEGELTRTNRVVAAAIEFHNSRGPRPSHARELANPGAYDRRRRDSAEELVASIAALDATVVPE